MPALGPDAGIHVLNIAPNKDVQKRLHGRSKSGHDGLCQKSPCSRIYQGDLPGGQAITSYPVGIPPGVLPATGWHSGGIGMQPMTVQAILRSGAGPAT
jgi:hypothetical protein